MNPMLDSLISAYFPHRHPFLLIDKVECIEDGRAVTLKSVTRTEPWFTGHFPDHPVLPGVILLEAMAQTGRFLRPISNKLVIARLARIDSARFYRQVLPGGVVRMEAKRLAEFGSISQFHVSATVSGEMCASAQFYVHAVMEGNGVLLTDPVGDETGVPQS